MTLTQSHSCPGAVAAGLLLGAAVFSAYAADTSASDSASADGGKTNSIERSVVKVFATVRYPDYFQPWTKQAPSEITGSGVVIEDKRILSNAHMVLYASQVQVQASQTGDSLPATVEFVAPEMDLAILKLDDENFFNTHPALPRASQLPNVKDSVMAYGFPTGGNGLSITKGIVSRIEFAPYGYPVWGLRIQIDAAINPGNSGGPAVAGDKMIGLTFSRLTESDNIGYIIPSEEIDLFLQDVADGRYDGKPSMFDQLQTMENPVLRPFLEIDNSVQGIIVAKPARPDAAYPLKKWDLITKIGDVPVDNLGMIKLNGDVQVGFQYMIQKLTKEGTVPLTVIRDGKEVTLRLPVPVGMPRVIPSLSGSYPSYFVLGPLVFSSASAEMAASFRGGDYAVRLAYLGNPLVLRLGDEPSFEGESLVFVSSPFFPHRLARGYSSPVLQVVKSVNGTAIKNLNHLVEVLRDLEDPFITFDFQGRGFENSVFKRSEILAATDEILSDNGVRAQGSPDTMAVWRVKPAQ